MTKAQKPLTAEQKRDILEDACYSDALHETYKLLQFCCEGRPNKGDSEKLKKVFATYCKQVRSAIKVIENDGY